MKKQIFIAVILLYSFNAHALSFRSILKLFGFGSTKTEQVHGVSHNQLAKPTDTHAGSGTCFNGKCATNTLTSKLKPISQKSGLSLGVDKTLVNLFRSCDANEPLQGLIYQDGPYVELSFNEGKRGAGLVANYFEGSIDTKRRVMDGALATQNSPYYPFTKNGQCNNPKIGSKTIDMNKTPVIFQNGSSMTFDKKSDRLNPYICSQSVANGLCNMDPQSHDAIALDCMEFVTMAMASSCLKFTTNDNFKNPQARFLGNKYEIGNQILAGTLKQKDSCFEPVKMDSADFLKEGDLLFGSEAPNHAIIATDVDPIDPFGIQKILQDPNKSCDDLTYRDFNFSISQSTTNANLGPSKMTAKEFICFYNRNQHLNENKNCDKAGNYDLPFPLWQLFFRAKDICGSIQDGTTLPKFRAEVNDKNKEIHHYVRHKDTEACKMNEQECPRVVGDECANDVCKMPRETSYE